MSSVRRRCSTSAATSERSSCNSTTCPDRASSRRVLVLARTSASTPASTGERSTGRSSPSRSTQRSPKATTRSSTREHSRSTACTSKADGLPSSCSERERTGMTRLDRRASGLRSEPWRWLRQRHIGLCPWRGLAYRLVHSHRTYQQDDQDDDDDRSEAYIHTVH